MNTKRNKADCSEDNNHYEKQNTNIVKKKEQSDLKEAVKTLVFGPVTLACNNKLRPKTWPKIW